MNSDTPRTDAAEYCLLSNVRMAKVVDADFARELERELDLWKRCHAPCNDNLVAVRKLGVEWMHKFNAAEKERDQWQKCATELVQAIKSRNIKGIRGR